MYKCIRLPSSHGSSHCFWPSHSDVAWVGGHLVGMSPHKGEGEHLSKPEKNYTKNMSMLEYIYSPHYNQHTNEVWTYVE